MSAPSRTYLHPLDQQPDDARLLGRGPLLLQRIELRRSRPPGLGWAVGRGSAEDGLALVGPPLDPRGRDGVAGTGFEPVTFRL